MASNWLRKWDWTIEFLFISLSIIFCSELHIGIIGWTFILSKRVKEWFWAHDINSSQAKRLKEMTNHSFSPF